MKKWIVILFSAVLLITGLNIVNKANTFTYNDAAAGRSLRTVILDAGHGGEDGGAVAPDGTAEKEINLEITKDIAVFFDLFGIHYIPVRTTDISVCDEGLDTIRKRKYSDIMNRASLVDSTPDSVLLSIHQNFFPEEKYSGTQVFYSKNTEDSAQLADMIQTSVTDTLQPENNRTVKAAGSEIYLLDKAKNTSVLVECGFLSNPQELSKLKDKTYQAKIAYRIFRGTFDFLTGTKEV